MKHWRQLLLISYSLMPHVPSWLSSDSYLLRSITTLPFFSALCPNSISLSISISLSGKSLAAFPCSWSLRYTLSSSPGSPSSLFVPLFVVQILYRNVLLVSIFFKISSSLPFVKISVSSCRITFLLSSVCLSPVMRLTSISCHKYIHKFQFLYCKTDPYADCGSDYLQVICNLRIKKWKLKKNKATPKLQLNRLLNDEHYEEMHIKWKKYNNIN